MTRERSRLRHGLALVLVVLGAGAVSVTASATTIRTVQLGSTITVTGQTGDPSGKGRVIGVVLVRESWDGGASKLVKTTHTDSRGHYRFVVTLRRRGLLTLRVTPPDKHDQKFLIRVV
jgi:hypothetical protein